MRANLIAVETEGRADVEKLIRITQALVHQNALQQAIIKQAAGHITRLEFGNKLRSDSGAALCP